VTALGLVAAGPANAAFTVVPSPNTGVGGNDLNGVSARSASDAWAVGALHSGREDAGAGTLTERWNGAAWSVVASPDNLRTDDVLDAVADISASNAWAVGFVKTSGTKTGAPLIVHFNGATWQTVSSPAGLSGVLRAVSADGASDVWAVGDDGRGHAIALRSDGVSWVSTALPAVGVDKLTGVKAFSPTDVWAVGSVVGAGAQGRTLAMHWNGSAWSVVPSANPDPNVDVLAAVDGLSSNDLWAVGLRGRSETMTGVGPGTRTLAEHWNGARWSAVTTPNTGDEDSLTGVAAATPTAVFSVGNFVQTGGTIPIDRTLAQRFNGASWAADPSANVGSTDNLLTGASAIPGTASAWAVGFRLTVSGPDQTLIERDG
jgi:hypothetical protein